MITPVNHHSLPGFLSLNDDDMVLEVKVDSELVWVDFNLPEFARLVSDFLPFDILEEVEVLRVQLHNVH